MGRTLLTYTAGLIAVYLVVGHATGAGTLLTKGSAAYNSGVRTLQGR